MGGGEEEGLSRLLGSLTPALVLGNSDMFSESAASCWSRVPFVYLSHSSRLPLPVQSLPAVQQHWRAGKNRDLNMSTRLAFFLSSYFKILFYCICIWSMLILLNHACIVGADDYCTRSIDHKAFLWFLAPWAFVQLSKPTGLHVEKVCFL